MKEELIKTIKAAANAASKAAESQNETADSVLKLSQAALNAAHALAIVENIKAH